MCPNSKRFSSYVILENVQTGRKLRFKEDTIVWIVLLWEGFDFQQRCLGEQFAPKFIREPITQ